MTYRWSRRGSEDQSTEVCSALVGESASGLEQSSNTVGLEGRAGEGSSPGSASRGGLLGLEELLRRVGGLGLAVGFAEDRAEDGEGGDVVKDSAERDGRWLDWWEVYEMGESVWRCAMSKMASTAKTNNRAASGGGGEVDPQ